MVRVDRQVMMENKVQRVMLDRKDQKDSKDSQATLDLLVPTVWYLDRKGRRVIKVPQDKMERKVFKDHRVMWVHLEPMEQTGSMEQPALMVLMALKVPRVQQDRVDRKASKAHREWLGRKARKET